MSHSLQLEHYLDSLESLPAELRRNFTLLRDLDQRSHGLSEGIQREAEDYSGGVAALLPSDRRRRLQQMDQLHGKLRELADDKVQLAIQTYELVDKHIRRLDSDLARFESELKQKGLSKRGLPLADDSSSGSGRRKTDQSGRKMKKTAAGEDSDGAPAQKRRSKKSGAGVEPEMPAITQPSDVLDMPVDPNEPTYCLCHQVSYGEMIGCDNLDCAVEWFHFACVGLTTKPKGKWFCPKCNQDKKKK